MNILRRLDIYFNWTACPHFSRLVKGNIRWVHGCASEGGDDRPAQDAVMLAASASAFPKSDYSENAAVPAVSGLLVVNEPILP